MHNGSVSRLVMLKQLNQFLIYWSFWFSENLSDCSESRQSIDITCVHNKIALIITLASGARPDRGRAGSKLGLKAAVSPACDRALARLANRGQLRPADPGWPKSAGVKIHEIGQG